MYFNIKKLSVRLAIFEYGQIIFIKKLSFYDKKLLTFLKLGAIMLEMKGMIKMLNKKWAKLLKSVICLLALLGVVMYAVVIPWSLSTFVEQYPEFSNFFTPWLIFICLTAIPVYIILAFGWSVSGEIGKDMCFTSKNAKSLRGVMLCLAFEAGLFFTGNIALWIANLNFLGVVLASTVLCIFIACIAVVVNILAHLVEKASAIREENESYI